MRRLLLVLPLLLLACDSNDTPTFIEPTDLSTFSTELQPLVGSWQLVKSISFGFEPQHVTTGDDLPTPNRDVLRRQHRPSSIR